MTQQTSTIEDLTAGQTIHVHADRFGTLYPMPVYLKGTADSEAVVLSAGKWAGGGVTLWEVETSRGFMYVRNPNHPVVTVVKDGPRPFLRPTMAALGDLA